MPVDPKPCFTDDEVRKAACRAVFAGACGANGVFQNHAAGMAPGFGVRLEWRDALNRPVSSQLQLLRRLLESKPHFSRVPRPGLVENNLVATGGAQGSFALVCLPRGGKAEVRLRLMRGAVRVVRPAHRRGDGDGDAWRWRVRGAGRARLGAVPVGVRRGKYWGGAASTCRTSIESLILTLCASPMSTAHATARRACSS